MYRADQVAAVWVARARVDHAVTQIAYAHCPAWQGGSAEAAEEVRNRLMASGVDLYHLLYEAGTCLQDVLDLQQRAAQSLMLQAAAA